MTRVPRRLAAPLALCVALVAIPAGTALAAFGDLDPSFDEDGALFDALTAEPRADIRDPRVAQAPYGTLVAAVLTGCSGGCQQTERNFTGTMRIIRASADGEVIHEENRPISGVGDLFDLRVLSDGTVVVVARNDQNNLHVTRLGADLEGPASEVYARDMCPNSGRILDVQEQPPAGQPAAPVVQQQHQHQQQPRRCTSRRALRIRLRTDGPRARSRRSSAAW